MENERTDKARELHQTLDYIGLRAHATAVGVLQLSAELVKAGILDHDAMDRIKDAIHSEISVSRQRNYNRAEFEETLRQRLDAIFPQKDSAERAPVGTVKEMENALAPDS